MAEVLELVQELDADLPRLMLDSMVDYAIFVLDAAGNVMSWNPGAERIKGWTRREIVGRHFSVFYTADDIASGKPWRELEQAEADGRLADEGWRLRKDGTAFWADVVITALRDSDGRLIGFAKVTRDLTARKQAAEAEHALVALRERERIARELHQGVIRTLFGIGLSIQAGAVDTNDNKLRSRLDTAVDGLDNAIKDLRSHVLNPQPLTPRATTRRRGNPRVSRAGNNTRRRQSRRSG